MKSKIGIVICGLMGEKQFVSDAYIKAVRSAGGLPIILPLVKSNEVIADYVKLCSGFLFCGGGDITPLLFGEEPARGIGETDIALDLFQIRLMKSILKSKKPVLAICRGMQILNVACHGTICQDIELRKEPSINHMQTSISRKDISHKVNTVAGSRLHRIIGEFAYTNSFHHQVIEEVGEALQVTGRTADGVIEAIEMPSHPFVLGVQWHPESMYEISSDMRYLFRAFMHFAEK